MGMYFTSQISCLSCGNSNTFDAAPFMADEVLQYIAKVKPRIICGRCGSENIKGSDTYFCSVDMSYDNRSSNYIPKNTDETWILPDCRQRLPETIYVDVGFSFHREKYTNICTKFEDFKRYEERQQQDLQNGVAVPFKRIKHLSEIQDLYMSEVEGYTDLHFCPTYVDRIPEGMTIMDFHNEEVEQIERMYAFWHRDGFNFGDVGNDDVN